MGSGRATDSKKPKNNQDANEVFNQMSFMKERVGQRISYQERRNNEASGLGEGLDLMRVPGRPREKKEEKAKVLKMTKHLWSSDQAHSLKFPMFYDHQVFLPNPDFNMNVFSIDQ